MPVWNKKKFNTAELETTEKNWQPLKRVIFRADGNSRIGLGHLVRSLALADMLLPDFSCFFAIQNPALNIQEEIKAAGLEIIILPETDQYIAEAGFLAKNILKPKDIVVLDGYHFNTSYQEILSHQEVKLVCLDDIHAFPFIADVIINQAGNISPKSYVVKPGSKLLLGPDYALLRKPFLQAARQHRTVNQVNRLFINMGGADPQNNTSGIIHEVLQKAPDLVIEVVIGGAYSYLAELKVLIAANPQIRLHQGLDAEQMCQLMQQCDAAILPPSSVSYEWCSVGGLLFLHQAASNQAGMASFLLQEGLAFKREDFQVTIKNPNLPQLIAAQINQQRKFFNGESPQKLRSIFFELLFQDSLRLRSVTKTDMLLLYEWANDPAVRENSFNTSVIPLEVHKLWFENKIKDDACLFLIAEVEGIPAGMIRFDFNNDQGIISFLLAHNFRGKGLGKFLLLKGEELVKKNFPEIKKLIGHVQEWNKASYISFQKSGYQLTSLIRPVKPGAVVFEKRFN